MRKGYRLANIDGGYQQWLLSPIGEKIALGTDKKIALGRDKGDRTFVIHSSELNIRFTNRDYATMREAYERAAELHYQANTSRPERFRNWIAEWSPLWGWLFGAVATIAAIWGWIA